MTKKLVWRLGKLPTVSELTELVKDKIITQEEAKAILFNNESEEDRDKKSLETEIKFLRELVEKLSQGRDRIIETVREVKVPYYTQPWYQPYATWCSATNITSDTVLCGLNGNPTNASFTSIKTF